MPNPVVLKVVLTNRTAARAKYGAGGWRKIREAVGALAKADAARGITTRLLALDSAADARKVDAAPVTGAGDVAGIKHYIDQLFATWDPPYVLLLGGPDLVGLVNLENPLWTGDPEDDPDRFIPSDLPYACPNPLTLVASAYRGPTRVIARIPDLSGEPDPSSLLLQLGLAAGDRSMVRRSPEPVFAVSARVWEVSTKQSIAGLPDVTGVVNTSPAAGPAWSKAQLAARLHFVNCHGAEFDPDWYGQATPTNWNLPTAVAAQNFSALTLAGQVVAAECCYGSAHWPPAAAHGQASLAMTYLMKGAAGVFAASTVAYGPARATNYADVVCRLFGEELLNGASLGRAALVARQRYVQSQPFMDPTDVKTLAQFSVLGDPSVVPFRPAGVGSPAVPRGRSVVASPKASGSILARRDTLNAVGAALDRTVLSCAPTPRPTAGISRRTLAGLIGREVPPGQTIRTFDAERAKGGGAGGGAADGARRARPGRGGRVAGARAHVAFVGGDRRRPPSLVVVREQSAGEPEVRVVVRR